MKRFMEELIFFSLSFGFLSVLNESFLEIVVNLVSYLRFFFVLHLHCVTVQSSKILLGEGIFEPLQPSLILSTLQSLMSYPFQRACEF